ncbi:MAG: hypothetical protein AAF479_04660, partial [Pseudomonadota bacterium]
MLVLDGTSGVDVGNVVLSGEFTFEGWIYFEPGTSIRRELMEATGETANLAIADDGDVVFISQVESHNPVRAFFRPGTRGHMHASGIGKALLSNMLRRDVEKILHNKG